MISWAFSRKKLHSLSPRLKTKKINFQMSHTELQYVTDRAFLVMKDAVSISVSPFCLAAATESPIMCSLVHTSHTRCSPLRLRKLFSVMVHHKQTQDDIPCCSDYIKRRHRNRLRFFHNKKCYNFRLVRFCNSGHTLWLGDLRFPSGSRTYLSVGSVVGHISSWYWRSLIPEFSIFSFKYCRTSE